MQRMATLVILALLTICRPVIAGEIPSMQEFSPPAPLPPAGSRIMGTLELSPDADDSDFEIIVDTFNAANTPQWKVNVLPQVQVDLVQDGQDVIPVQRGAIPGEHPYWEWMFEPGKAWDEPGQPGVVRVALPFALQERNQNCTHNGVLSLSISEGRGSTTARYLVASETCKYLKANLHGTLNASFRSTRISTGDEVIAAHRRLVKVRLPVRPIESLAADFTGIDDRKFTPPGAEDVTVYGLVANGIHYRGGCKTRLGPYPFCDWIGLPSYSLAKSVFAGLAFMYLDSTYPSFAQSEVTALVPECRLPDGRWDGVTLSHLLNMTTGNYEHTGFEQDEGAANVAAFFLPETHAEKLRFSCETYQRKSPPGDTFVYHTFDTYLLGTAMNTFLRRQTGDESDIFTDILHGKLLGPLHLSPVARTTRRTYDETAQPFTGYGLTWNPDDIARIGLWLNQGAGLLSGSDALAHALFRDARKVRRLDESRGEAYRNGFWGFDIAAYVPCSEPVWVPFMSGYGGNIVALSPGGSVYYYFSDGDRFKWASAVSETHKLSNLCD